MCKFAPDNKKAQHIRKIKYKISFRMGNIIESGNKGSGCFPDKHNFD